MVAACGEESAPRDISSGAALAPEGFDVPETDREAPLPAYQTQGELEAEKADRFDVRGNFQDIYGITNAPAGGVRAVAEFETSDGVLVSWDDWQEDFVVNLVNAIEDAAPVYVITRNLSESQYVEGRLLRAGVNVNNVAFFEFVNDSIWSRDYGPIPAIRNADGEPVFIDQRYFPNRQRDDAVPTLMGRYFDVDTYRPNISSEGGNFMSNGIGDCIMTEWIQQGNFGLSNTQIREIKRDYYGCNQLVILERIAGEGTGHVDMFAKFVSVDTVLVGEYSRSDDPTNAAILDRNAARLQNVRLANGQPLNVVRIPMPANSGPVYRSYTNSTIVNNTVIVPIYRADRRFEDQAIDVYERTMPGYRIVTVPSDNIIEMGGAVHCTTMGFALNTSQPPAPVDPTPDPDPIVEPQPTANGVVSQPQAPIRDLDQTLDTITISDRADSGTVVVTVDIDHTYVGDLLVALIHGNDYVILHQQEGGSAQGLKRTYTVDGFAGVNRQGDWTLYVEDTARQDEGTLNAWAIDFQ